jgi:hypothetical protein
MLRKTLHWFSEDQVSSCLLSFVPESFALEKKILSQQHKGGKGALKMPYTLKPMMGVLTDRKKSKTQKTGPFGQRQRQRLGVMQPQAIEHLEPPEAGRDKKVFDLCVFTSCSDHSLISDF